jgi:hypothetical protein
MRYRHTAEKLTNYRRQIHELRQKMRDVQAAVEPEPVKVSFPKITSAHSDGAVRKELAWR